MPHVQNLQPEVYFIAEDNDIANIIRNSIIPRLNQEYQGDPVSIGFIEYSPTMETKGLENALVFLYKGHDTDDCLYNRLIEARIRTVVMTLDDSDSNIPDYRKHLARQGRPAHAVACDMIVLSIDNISDYKSNIDEYRKQLASPAVQSQV